MSASQDNWLADMSIVLFGREDVDYSVACTILIGTATALLYMQPSSMFMPDGKFKEFGSKPHQTILPFWLVTSTLPMVYYILLADK
tara:strand:- start:164 stop:421 length:258 start_codon:yes stop_codon:yes gene_type:complete